MTNESNKTKIILMKDGILSYPHIAEPSRFDNNPASKPRYQAKILIRKDHPQLNDLATDLKAVHKNNEIEIPLSQMDNRQLFFQDGDKTDKEEQKGHYILSLSSQNQPGTYNRDKSRVHQNQIESTFYGGCRVNVQLNIYVLDNKYGCFIRANLIALQFLADGTPFASRPSADEIEGGFDIVPEKTIAPDSNNSVLSDDIPI